MSVERKKTHIIIQEFSKIIYEADPMGLGSPNNDEYDSEALTILARFNEAGIMGAPNDVRLEVASAIVAQALEFWFDEVPSTDCNQMTSKLIESFVQGE